MRILIVFHGWFPTPGRPVAGGALRAWHHAEALRAAGHEVHCVTRDQDAVPGGPPTFASGPGLRAHAERIQPDVLLCVQPEEAPHLAPLGLPTVVDLYAPRILEAQFQDTAGVEAVNTLRAIAAGDFFLFSNPRQRDYYLGLLALAGVDLRSHDFGAVVPLVAPQGPSRKLPRHPVFVMGGVSWPWVDPIDALSRAVTHLEKRRKGKLLLLGHKPVVGDAEVKDLRGALPPGKRLEYGGVLPYDELLATYATATAAIDMMRPTPERSLAVAFRHMDYLGSGLPMIVGGEHVLADTLRDAGAGWVGLPIEDALDRAMDEREAVLAASNCADDLARAAFSRAQCEAPLLAWLEAPRRRQRVDTPLGELAEVNATAARAEAQRAEAERVATRLEAEVEAKRAEVAGLVQQTRVLAVATERLAGSVAEVSGFKREAIAVLGGAQAHARDQLEAAKARLSTVEADNRKKSAELDAALRAKVDAHRVASDDARKKSAEIDALMREKDLLGQQNASLEQRLERIAGLEGQLQAVRLDLVKKDGELDALTQERDLVRDRLGVLEGRHAVLASEERAARAEARRLATSLAVAEADLGKKDKEIEALALEAQQARAQQSALGSQLAAAQADSAKKSAELEAQAQERDDARTAKERMAEDLVALRTEKRQREAELAASFASLDASRAREAAQVEALADARADAVKKGAEMEALRLAHAQVCSDLEAARAELDRTLPSAVRVQAELDIARQQLDVSRASEASLREAVTSAQADMAAKGAELAALERQSEGLRGAEERALSALDKLRAELEQRAAGAARADEAAGQLRARIEALDISLADTQADIDKKNGELEQAWQERERLEGVIASLRGAKR